MSLLIKSSGLLAKYFPTRKLIIRSISNQTTSPPPSKTNETLHLFLRSINESHPFYPGNQTDYGSEKDIVRQFFKLADVNNPLMISHNSKQWKELRESSQHIYSIPEIPKSLNSFTLPKYIKKLSHVKTRGRGDLLQSVSDSYLSIINSNLVFDIDSHNTILNFFARRYKFNQIKLILNKMIDRNIDPNIRTFNILLFSLIHCKHKQRNRLCANYLHHMEAFEVRPDLTTWFIMLSFLQLEKLTIYSEMKKLKLPMSPVIEEVIAIKWTQEDITPGELNEYLEDMNTVIDDKIICTVIGLYLQRDDPESALEYLDSVFPNIISFIPPNILLCFVAYFCGRNEIYNGVAMINYFRDNYSLNYKPFKAYGILADALINVPNFSNWSILVRRFYLDSMYNFSDSAISDYKISEINNLSVKYGYAGFRLNEIRLDEADEVRAHFEKLRWTAKPILTLEDNTQEFIEAANYMRACKT